MFGVRIVRKSVLSVVFAEGKRKCREEKRPGGDREPERTAAEEPACNR